jgi:hypothetical protein
MSCRLKESLMVEEERRKKGIVPAGPLNQVMRYVEMLSC